MRLEIDADPSEDCISHHAFAEIQTMLVPGDVLVLNSTRVRSRRLRGCKVTGGKVELLLLQSINDSSFLALARPASTLRCGSELHLENELRAVVLENLSEGQVIVKFKPVADLEKKLESAGTIPLPPYIKTHISEESRYQTVYGEGGYSAAAPTAGLHFTKQLLNAIESSGVAIAKINLDIGIDTFQPIRAQSVADHKMHGESCSISSDAATTINSATGRIIAVGTTVVRTLETFASRPGRVESGATVSDLFITPGYEFQVVDGMLTNFHAPKSSMLLMISAMCGRPKVMHAYETALHQGYRFLSFGDAMIII